MTSITDYKAYKLEIVDKDHAEFLANDGNVRAAFHSAISLFHLHDWVYAAHKPYIDANFTFLRAPPAGPPPVATPVTKSSQFADALADVSPLFVVWRTPLSISRCARPTRRDRRRHRTRRATPPTRSLGEGPYSVRRPSAARRSTGRPR